MSLLRSARICRWCTAVSWTTAKQRCLQMLCPPMGTVRPVRRLRKICADIPEQNSISQGTVSAARLADMGVPAEQLIVTTFGSPAVGNAAFVRTYEGKFTLYRVVMSGDPMKNLLAAPLGFRQFGERIAWTPARSVAAFPHAMTVYVDAAIRQLYDAYGGDSAFLFLMGQPNRAEGRTVYVAPIEAALDDSLAEDAPYMKAVLRDALHVRNASVVFAAGGGGLSENGLLSGRSGADGGLSDCRGKGA